MLFLYFKVIIHATTNAARFFVEIGKINGKHNLNFLDSL